MASYDCSPLVCEPAGSVPALRQIPKGLIPNLTHGLAAWMRCPISCTIRLTLLRRQSWIVLKPAPWVA